MLYWYFFSVFAFMFLFSDSNAYVMFSDVCVCCLFTRKITFVLVRVIVISTKVDYISESNGKSDVGSDNYCEVK